MHHLNVLLDLVRQNERVCVCFGLREHDSLSSFSVDNQNVSKSREPVLEWALDGQMFHSPGSLVLEVHRKVDNSDALLHMRGSNITDPSWDGSREKANLQISTTLLSAFAQNLQKNEV